LSPGHPPWYRGRVSYSEGDPKLHGPRKMSQREIARRTGLHTSTVSKLLQRGRGGWPTIRLVASTLGMSLDEFAREYLGFTDRGEAA
jgi:transcriptional regulator with XRE-family HTH domain